jgi:murein DD-endopeptidase MepM/ murein hydrolase activator NlpD
LDVKGSRFTLGSDSPRASKPRPRFRPERRQSHLQAGKPARRSSGPGQWIVVALLGLAIAWGAAATWMALSAKQTIAELREEQAAMRLASDEKVKALTRRLVGVASHQILEADGLEGRMADLITRQVQLENRQAMLTVLAKQATAASLAPDVGTGAVTPTADGAAATPGTLRLGAPSPGLPDAGNAYAPKPPPAPPSPLPMPEPRARAPGPSGLPSPHLLKLPLREQFAHLEQSTSRVGAAQVHYLDSLVKMSQGQAVLIRTALAELGLDLDKLAPGAAKPGTGGPFVPLPGVRDPFELGYQQAQRAHLALERLRRVTEVVPLRRPIEGENNLSSNFGPRTDPFTGAAAMHSGMDFRSPVGTPVRAAGQGRVVTADVTGGYGNLVELDHGHGIVTRYAHLSEISVSHGQIVKAGSVVGLVGSTGRSTGPHLHYETRLAGSAVDPMRFLRVGAKLLAPHGKHEQAPQFSEAPTSEAADD